MSDPEFITALRAGRPEHTPDVVGVLVQRTGDAVVITLDDGETLELSAGELHAALHMEEAA